MRRDGLIVIMFTSQLIWFLSSVIIEAITTAVHVNSEDLKECSHRTTSAGFSFTMETSVSREVKGETYDIYFFKSEG